MRAPLVILAFVVYLFTARWYFVCQLLNICDASEVPELSEEMRTLSVTDTGQVVLSGFQQFAFERDEAWPLLPATKRPHNNLAFLDTLTEYLLRDYYMELLIIGRLAEDEIGLSSSYFENLGLARADAIRRLLVRQGLPEDKIRLDYEVTDTAGMREPLSFAIYRTLQWPNGITPALYSFKQMSFSTLNFPVGDQPYAPGLAFEEYARLLKSYMEENAINRIRIVGHVARGESDQEDDRRAMAVAESARGQLMRLGVNVPMTTEAHGSLHPIAPPDTEEGRKKNERVTFFLE